MTHAELGKPAAYPSAVLRLIEESLAQATGFYDAVDTHLALLDPSVELDDVDAAVVVAEAELAGAQAALADAEAAREAARGRSREAEAHLNKIPQQPPPWATLIIGLLWVATLGLVKRENADYLDPFGAERRRRAAAHDAAQSAVPGWTSVHPAERAVRDATEAIEKLADDRADVESRWEIAMGLAARDRARYAVAVDHLVKARNAYAAGVRTEQRVADALRALSPDALVHGAYIGSGGDIDHVVLSGGVAVAVEAKTGRGRVQAELAAGEPELTLNGKAVAGGPLGQLRRGVAALEAIWNVTVAPVVCVADMDGAPVQVAGVTVCSVDDLAGVVRGLEPSLGPDVDVVAMARLVEPRAPEAPTLGGDLDDDAAAVKSATSNWSDSRHVGERVGQLHADAVEKRKAGREREREELARKHALEDAHELDY